MDGELKAIMITIAVIVVVVCGIQIFYPGGWNALGGIFGK